MNEKRTARSIPIRTVASASECTGLYAALPQDEEEKENLDDLMDVMD